MIAAAAPRKDRATHDSAAGNGTGLPCRPPLRGGVGTRRSRGLRWASARPEGGPKAYGGKLPYQPWWSSAGSTWRIWYFRPPARATAGPN